MKVALVEPHAGRTAYDAWPVIDADEARLVHLMAAGKFEKAICCGRHFPEDRRPDLHRRLGLTGEGE